MNSSTDNSMSIAHTRICFFLLFMFIVLAQHYYMLVYEAVIWVFIEWINYRLKTDNRHRLARFSSYAVVYLLLICLDRILKPDYGNELSAMVNIAEHLVFSCIAMFMLLLIFDIFLPNMHSALSIVLIFIAANSLGFLNELYQNMLHRHITEFTADSYKDMWVNLIASVLFVLIYILYPKKKPITS